MFINEAAMTRALSTINPDTKAPKSQYSNYDLYTKKSIIELKARRGNRQYPDTMIERYKMDKNLEHSKNLCKDFVYCVYSEAHEMVFFFNITKLVEEGYNFNWHVKMCPTTTEFSNTHKIEKEVGGIVWDKAFYTISLKELSKLL